MATKIELHIRKWLTDLGARCSSTANAEAAEAKARDYAQALVDIDAGAFCQESLEAAARQFEYFPAYATIRKFVEAWWADARRRARPALPGADDPSLTEEDRQHLAVFLKHRAAGFPPGIKLADLASAPEVDRETFRQRLALRLSRMRSGPLVRLFRHICRTDVEAAAIAVARGWQVEPSEHKPPSDVAIAAVEATVRQMFAAQGHTAQAGAIEAAAAAQEAARRQQEAERMLAQARRPSGALDPGDLEAQRAANPAIQIARAYAAGRKAAQRPAPPTIEGEAQDWTPRARVP